MTCWGNGVTNGGHVAFGAHTGAIATAPAPGSAPEKNKVAPPKPAYGLILRVRKSDEADFTDKTKKLGKNGRSV